MAERHAAKAGQEAAAEAGRERTEPPEPASMEDAAAIVREGLGPGAVKWERTFHRTTGHDGETIYVDTQTGQMYDTIPNLHQSDGKPS